MKMNQNISESDLKDAMSLANARVYHYQQFGWTQFTKSELQSAAYEGISEAILRFAPEKGTVKETKFTSYAYFWIEKYIKEFITNNKTMLSGSNGELWSGQVPYTNSIDAYDDSSNDTSGSDHKDWLGTNILPSACLESEQTQKQCELLLAKIFIELEPIERLCMQLSLGIGTIGKVQLTVKQIAKQTNMTKPAVEACINNAKHKMQAKKEEYYKYIHNIF